MEDLTEGGFDHLEFYEEKVGACVRVHGTKEVKGLRARFSQELKEDDLKKVVTHWLGQESSKYEVKDICFTEQIDPMKKHDNNELNKGIIVSLKEKTQDNDAAPTE